MKKTTLTLFLIAGMLTALFAQQSTNYAGTFNGTSYINFQDQPALTPPQFSMEAWVFIGANPSSSMCIIGKSYLESYYFAIANGNRVRFVPSKWANGYLDSKPVLVKQKWTHVAATYDGTIAKIYIDGILDTTQANLGSVLDTKHDLWVGRDRNGLTPSYAFKGSLDEVRIWNRVLTQTEIVQNKHLSFSLANDANAYKGLLLNLTFQQSDSFSRNDQSALPNVLLESEVVPLVQTQTASDYLSHNSSLQLNGTDAYIAFAHDTALSVANGSFTIEAWVYRNAAQLGMVYSKHNVAYNKGLTVAVNGTGNVSCKTNGSTTNSNGQLVLNRWNHIAVTFDGTNCAYYINGALDKTFPMSTIEYVPDSAFIGKRILGDGFFNGYIDELRIAKRARNLAEIRAGMFRSFSNLAAVENGLAFLFEGNTQSSNNVNRVMVGQLMGGATFSSTAVSGVPVSPVLRQLPGDMNIQVEGMAIHKKASIYTGSILIDRNLKVEDVKVFVNMNHTNMAHTRLRLVNPVGDTLVLMQNTAPLNPTGLTTIFAVNATAMENARLSFAPAILPQNDLGMLNKRTAPGIWKLEISSPDSMDAGIIYGWGLAVTGKEILPVVYTSEPSKAFAVKGYTAAIDSVIVSGEFLTQEVTLSLEAPFSIQLPGKGGYVQQITLPLTGDSISTRSIVIRYHPLAGITHQTYLKINSPEFHDSVLLSGIVKLPSLLFSVDSIAPFTVTKVNTASAETEFTAEGVFLEDTIHVHAGGPFEVSLTSGSGFGPDVTIPVDGDTLKAVSIFVRYRPASGSTHADTLFLSSGQITRNLKLSGKVGPPTGLAETEPTNKIQCYPNPTANRVTIESVMAIEALVLTDLNGRERLKAATNILDVSGLESGVYLVRVHTAAGVETIRLAVVH